MKHAHSGDAAGARRQTDALKNGLWMLFLFGASLLILGSLGFALYSTYVDGRRVKEELLWLNSSHSFDNAENWDRLVRDIHERKFIWGPDREKWNKVREYAISVMGWTMRKEAVGCLLQALGDADPEIAAEAAGALWPLGDSRAVEPLISNLQHGSVTVREGAARSLGYLGDRRAVQPLIACLEDFAPDVACAAAAALKALDDQRAVEPLIAALKRADHKVRGISAEALGHLEDRGALQPLVGLLDDEDSSVGRAVTSALNLFIDDPRAVELFQSCLGDPNPKVRERAAVVLSWRRDPMALDPLLAALDGEDSEDITAAIEALGRLDDVRAVNPLVSALNHQASAGRRASAALALGNLGFSEALEPLIAALGDSEELVASASAAALGSLGHMKGLEALLSPVAHTRAGVRKSVASALGNFKNTRATEMLVRLLSDPASEVRANALAALGFLSHTEARGLAHAALVDPAVEVRYHAFRVLCEMGDAGVLVQLMNVASRDSDVAYIFHTVGADFLMKLENTGAVDPLLEALNENDVWVWGCASLALASFDDARISNALETLYQEFLTRSLNQNAAARDSRWGFMLSPGSGAVAFALGWHGDDRSFDLLVKAAQEEGETVRAMAVRGAAYLQVPRVPDLLCAALKDPSRTVRREAAEMLAFFPAEKTRDFLLCALEDDDKQVRNWAAMALALSGNPCGSEEFFEQSDNVGLVIEAASYYDGIRHFEDPSYEYNRIGLLACLESPKFLPRFSRLLQDRDHPYRLVASLVLSRLPPDQVRAALEARPKKPRAAQDFQRLDQLFALQEAQKAEDSEALRSFAGDPDPAVSVIASGCLFQSDPPAALDRAFSCFQGRPERHKQGAWSALVAYGDRLPDAFLAGLQERVTPRWRRPLGFYRRFWNRRR
ncbi:MAG: HEAT repeat domain-containing protein [Planctomycetes bacterium]|nr:HEAT repeat domain-containing protein [Planctomycetota bacterium]